MLSRNEVKVIIIYMMMLSGITSQAFAEQYLPSICDLSIECKEESRKLDILEEKSKRYFATLLRPGITHHKVNQDFTAHLIFHALIEKDEWEFEQLEIIFAKDDYSSEISLTKFPQVLLYKNEMKIKNIRFPEVGEWNLIVKIIVNGQNFRQIFGPYTVE